MKITFAFLIFIILSSGCSLNDCEPPDPELSEIASSWIDPYENKSYFTFRDSTGFTDTLMITKDTDTDYCGDGNCGNNCKAEVILLSSRNNPNLSFSVAARLKESIYFNKETSIDSMLSCIYHSDRNVITINQAHGLGSLNENYVWNGDHTTVVKLYCSEQVNCDIKANNIVFSMEYGLIEYTTNEGRYWKKTE